MTHSMHVQHQDMNVGPTHYNHLDDNQLLVTEIRYTIQGEGPYSGWPALVVELAGCNRGRKDDMGCRFCSHAFYYGKGRKLRFSEITAAFKALMPHPDLIFPLVAITGGEPMLQNNLTAFMTHLYVEQFYDVQIESNGDRLADGFLDSENTSNAKLMISPKAERGGYQALSLKVHSRADFLKFSVSAEADSPYYNIPDYATDFAFGMEGKPVYLSPIMVYSYPRDAQAASAWDRGMLNVESTKANFKRARELALKTGFRLSMPTDLWFCVE